MKMSTVNNSSVAMPSLRATQFKGLTSRFMADVQRRRVFESDNGRQILSEILMDYTASEELKNFVCGQSGES